MLSSARLQRTGTAEMFGVDQVLEILGISQCMAAFACVSECVMAVFAPWCRPRWQAQLQWSPPQQLAGTARLLLPESMARILAIVRDGICSKRQHCHNPQSLEAGLTAARLPCHVQAQTSFNEDKTARKGQPLNLQHQTTDRQACQSNMCTTALLVCCYTHHAAIFARHITSYAIVRSGRRSAWL